MEPFSSFFCCLFLEIINPAQYMALDSFRTIFHLEWVAFALAESVVIAFYVFRDLIEFMKINRIMRGNDKYICINRVSIGV